jgi:two-component system, chemotaxis family, response regulator WspR
MMSELVFPETHQVPALSSFRIKVLLVDDQAIVAEALRRLLVDNADIEFHAISDGEQALQAAQKIKPTVILQDLMMPKVDGFELVRRFRSHPDTESIPIIVLSANDDPQLKARGFEGGANDYVVKLPDKLELVARIRYHSNAYISRLQRDDAFRSLRVSQRQLAEVNLELQKQASLDGLTGIANRRRLDEALQGEWQRAQRSQCPLSLLLCDIDFFKGYNDTYGHLAGDLCLKKVAQVLAASVRRPADLAARYGGEEFVVLLPDTDLEGALAVAASCREEIEALAVPTTVSSAAGVVTMSIGVASLIPPQSMRYEKLVSRADLALYKAKDNGRNRVSSFVDVE